MEISRLVTIFDQVVSNNGEHNHPPTAESIARINTHFGITLPPSFVKFAAQSKNFRSWFSSLGEDFCSPSHIIRTNSHFKNIRRRREQRWCYVKPASYIVVNLGFDQDCDCIDASRYNSVTGEYVIRYWYPGMAEDEETSSYDCFEDYIRRHILSWSRKRHPEIYEELSDA